MFQNLPNVDLDNVNLNSVGSQYANNYNHNISLLVEKLTNKMIYDASPKQFFDLKLLNMKQYEKINSDEFFYKEMGYQRKPLSVTASAATVTHPTTQTITVSTVDHISDDTIIIYPDNSKGTVVNVNKATNQITVAPYTGDTLPAVSSGDELSNQSSVEGDGGEGFAQHFRADTIERFNYVQLFSKAIRYGELELFKMKNNGSTKNFLQMERKAMYRQFRIDISNQFWNGKKGEVTLKSGKKAKTTGGVFPSMVSAGSPNASATTSTLPGAFESVVLDSEFGEYGDVRFCFGSPRQILKLSKAYKDDKTRYAPNDMVAKLNLEEINIGSSRIVLVPFKRFEDQASFPSSFRDRLIILDMKNISICQMWGERSGETLDRVDGVPKKYKDMWVDANMGVKFNNPLGCAYIDIQ